MTPEQLRAIMDYLVEMVRLKDQQGDGEVAVEFNPPSVEDAARAGLDADGYKQLLDSPWWGEMVDDIIETPDMCDPDDPAEQVLQYAKDVVSEYIRKRAEL